MELFGILVFLNILGIRRLSLIGLVIVVDLLENVFFWSLFFYYFLEDR